MPLLVEGHQQQYDEGGSPFVGVDEVLLFHRRIGLMLFK
jgi:hypothetical protein